MNIIYTCPRCGNDLLETVLTCDPPIYKKECKHCGWSHEEREKVIRIPYPEKKDNVVDLGDGFYSTTNVAILKNYCADCLNNPSNGGSGICHCILGSSIY